MHCQPMIVIAVVFAGAATLTPATMHAQDVLKKIREQARQKIETRKAKADSVAIERVGRTVDSTLTKTGRGVDTVVNRAAGLADAAVNRTASVISAAGRKLAGGDDEDAKLAAAVATGRAVVPGIRFEERTDMLALDAAPHVARLARLLVAQPGIFVLEGHVEATGDDAGDRDLSQRRAAALRTRLVAAGLPAERLFAMGLGGTRPAAGAAGAAPPGARIEIARLQ